MSKFQCQRPPLECGGLTPLWSFLSLRTRSHQQGRKERKEEKKGRKERKKRKEEKKGRKERKKRKEEKKGRKERKKRKEEKKGRKERKKRKEEKKGRKERKKRKEEKKESGVKPPHSKGGQNPERHPDRCLLPSAYRFHYE